MTQPTPFQTLTITGAAAGSGMTGSLGTLVIPAGSGPGIIQNMDEKVTIYVGEDASITPGDVAHSSPLLPGTPMGFDGTGNVYCGCLAGQQAELAIYPTATSTIVPGFIADQIQISGVPPIDNPVPVYIAFQQSIAAGGTFQTPNIDVSQFQSFVGTMFSAATSAGVGTIPFLKMHVAWSLVVDGFDPLHAEDWVVPTTPFNFFYVYRNDLQGPVYGNSVSLTFTNYDTEPCLITIGLFGSYRTRIRSAFRGRYAWNSDGSPNDAAGMGSDSIITSYNTGAIAVGSVSSPALMNLFNGPVTVSASVTGAAAAQTWDVRIVPQPTSILASTIVCTNDTLNRLNPRTVMLPRRVCSVFVGNDSGNALTSAQVVVIGQEQPE